MTMKITMIHDHMVAEVGHTPQLWKAGESHETSDVTATLLIRVGVAKLAIAGKKDAPTATTLNGEAVLLPDPLTVVALVKAMDAPENKAVAPAAKK